MHYFTKSTSPLIKGFKNETSSKVVPIFIYISAKALCNCLFSWDVHILTKSKQLYHRTIEYWVWRDPLGSLKSNCWRHSQESHLVPSLPPVVMTGEETILDCANRNKLCTSLLYLLYLSQKAPFGLQIFMMKGLPKIMLDKLEKYLIGEAVNKGCKVQWHKYNIN